MKLAAYEMLVKAHVLYPLASGIPTPEYMEIMADIWAVEFTKAGCQPMDVLRIFDQARASRRDSGEKLAFMPTCDELLREWEKTQPDAEDKFYAQQKLETQKMLDEMYGGHEARMLAYAERDFHQRQLEQSRAQALPEGSPQ